MIAFARRQPVAYGYVRKSVVAPGETDEHALEFQKDAIATHYASVLKEKGYLWGDFYEDPDVSGGTRFASRKAGRVLDGRAAKGDCIIVHKMDRSFRNITDALCQMDNWSTRGVLFITLDNKFDLQTAVGRFGLNVLLAASQLQRELTSERNKEKCALRRRKGLAVGGTPFQCRRVRTREGTKFVLDEKKLPYLARIMELKLSGHSSLEIMLITERERCEREGIEFRLDGLGHPSRLCGAPGVTTMRNRQYLAARLYREGKLPVTQTS